LKVIMASNHEWVVPASGSARRFAVYAVPPALMGNKAYFDALVSWLDNGGREAWLYYLLHLDLRGFDIRAVPKSEALEEQQAATADKDPVTAWWHSVLSEGGVTRGLEAVSFSDATDDTAVSSRALRDSYSDTVHGARAPTFDQAMRRMKKWHPRLEHRRRRVPGQFGTFEYYYLLPSLQTMRTEFFAATRVRIDSAVMDD